MKLINYHLYQCFKYYSLNQITLEQVKQVISRPYLMYEIPHLMTYLSQNVVDKLKLILQINPEQVETYSRFGKYICEILQNYIMFCGTPIFQQRIKNQNLMKKLKQYEPKLKVFEKLKEKYQSD